MNSQFQMALLSDGLRKKELEIVPEPHRKKNRSRTGRRGAEPLPGHQKLCPVVLIVFLSAPT